MRRNHRNERHESGRDGIKLNNELIIDEQKTMETGAARIPMKTATGRVAGYLTGFRSTPKCGLPYVPSTSTGTTEPCFLLRKGSSTLANSDLIPLVL